jgi:transcriptional regulator with XRE-family HTH domain
MQTERPFRKLGQNIRAARLRASWTQEHAAERCGVSLKYWQTLEMGLKAPAFSTLCRIRGKLDVSWDDLCREC